VHEISEILIREHTARKADDPETLRQMLPDIEIEKRGDELFSAQISGSAKDNHYGRHG
jgi:hypothetical protein